MTDPIPGFQIFNPAGLEPELGRGLRELDQDGVIRRLWARDWTVWKAEDREISDRLGWLDAPAEEMAAVAGIEEFVASVREVGISRAVVLGMGGSSLAPDVFARMFPKAPGGLDLEVLDTTEPGAVADAGVRLDVRKTLFVVSSKSGTTAEVLALLAYFCDRARGELGGGHAGSRFIAITDPGTPLEGLARELHFRRVFAGRPDIGGRFSALSAFGLVPAALKGIDLRRLLASAEATAAACRVEPAHDNPGALLGTILGTAARKGMDKLTFLMPPKLRPLAGWLEQLIAESTGKEGRGIVPVIEDRPGPGEGYGADRLFVEFGSSEGPGPKSGPGATVGSASPLLRFSIDDPYEMAGQFYLWEFTTAIAGRFLGLNPFDQPDVESTKKKTRELLAASGPAPADRPMFHRGLRVVGTGPAESPDAAMARFLSGAGEGDYIALLAFLPKRPAVEELLSGLAAGLRFKTRLPVTVGFGPRYLHSTGQLHKGDGNRGLFLMLTAAGLPSVGIPVVLDISRPAADFAALFAAQAEGDRLALAEKSRRVLALELAAPVETGLAALSAFLG